MQGVCALSVCLSDVDGGSFIFCYAPVRAVVFHKSVILLKSSVISLKSEGLLHCYGIWKRKVAWRSEWIWEQFPQVHKEICVCMCLCCEWLYKTVLLSNTSSLKQSTSSHGTELCVVQVRCTACDLACFAFHSQTCLCVGGKGICVYALRIVTEVRILFL